MWAKVVKFSSANITILQLCFTKLKSQNVFINLKTYKFPLIQLQQHQPLLTFILLKESIRVCVSLWRVTFSVLLPKRVAIDSFRQIIRQVDVNSI